MQPVPVPKAGRSGHIGYWITGYPALNGRVQCHGRSGINLPVAGQEDVRRRLAQHPPHQHQSLASWVVQATMRQLRRGPVEQVRIADGHMLRH